MNEASSLTMRDRKTLRLYATRGAVEDWPYLVIGETQIWFAHRVDLRGPGGRLSWSAEQWGQAFYWSVGHVNRSGNGGGGGGVRTEAEAVERIERHTGRTVWTQMELFA